MRTLLILLLIISQVNLSAQNDSITVIDWLDEYYSQDTIFDGSAALDANGICIAGHSNTQTSGSDFRVNRYANDGVLLWTESYNGTGNGTDRALDVLCLQNSRVLVTGQSIGLGGNNDMVTLKYNANGNLQWEHRLDNGGNDIPVKLLNDGNSVYVFGNSAIQGEGQNIIVQKLNNGGNVSWSYAYDFAGSNDQLRDAVMDMNGNLYLTGGSVSPSGSADLVVIKLDPNGNEEWVYRYDGTFQGTDIGYAIVVDQLGETYVTGTSQIQTGIYDQLVLKIDANGSMVWENRQNLDSGFDAGIAIALSNSGNIIVAGEAAARNGTNYIRTFSIRNDGEVNWEQSFYGEELDCEVKGIAIDQMENIYVGGNSKSATTSKDFAIVCYNSRGIEIWKDRYSGSGSGQEDELTDIGITPAGKLVVTGTSSGQNGFAMTTIQYRKESVLIPRDYFDEPLGERHIYWQNKGQIRDLNDQPVDGLLSYTDQTYPQLFHFDDGLKMVFLKSDTSGNDTSFRVDMNCVGSSAQPSKAMYLKTVPYYQNYYKGFAPEGRTHISGYQRIHYPAVYPNVDLQYSSNTHGLSYSFIVYPGGDPTDISMEFEGATNLSFSTTGDFTIETPMGNLTFEAGFVSQIDGNGNKIDLPWRAEASDGGNNKIKLSLGLYNIEQPLVIQFVRGHGVQSKSGGPDNLEFSTYWGGANGYTDFNGITSNSQGNVYIAGSTSSTNFSPGLTAGIIVPHQGDLDALILAHDKLIEPLWITHLGGTQNINGSPYDVAQAVTLLNNGFIYIGGYSMASDMPVTTPASYPNAYRDDINICFTDNDCREMLLAVFKQGGELFWSSYYGNLGNDEIIDVGGNSIGDLYAVGYGANSITTINENGATNLNSGRGFILKFDKFYNDTWGTHFLGGGSHNVINALDFDANDNLYITGSSSGGLTVLNPDPDLPSMATPSGDKDAFIAKFDAHDFLDWAMYAGDESEDLGTDVKVNSQGDIYFAGTTSLPVVSGISSFPVWDKGNTAYFQPGNANTLNFISANTWDCYLMHLDVTGDVKHSTHFGGEIEDFRAKISFDSNDNLYLTGATTSGIIGFNEIPFPATPLSNAYTLNTHQNPNNPSEDFFIAAFNSNTSLKWSTYFGGRRRDLPTDIHVSEDDKLYLTGFTFTNNQFLSGGDIPFPIYDFDDLNPLDYYQFEFAGQGGGSGSPATLARFDLGTIAVGLQDIPKLGSSLLNIYPNPSNGEITLSFIDLKQSPISIEIYDLEGRRIQSLDWQGGSSSKQLLNISYLESGCYLIGVITNTSVHIKQLIINHP